MSFFSKLDKLIIRIAPALVILVVVGIPSLSWYYESQMTSVRHPGGTKVFNLTGVGKDKGFWTLERVTGLNYWQNPGVEPVERIVLEEGDRVVLRITSADVYHGFGFKIPGYRTTKEIHPGQMTTVEFTADKVGEYRFLCTIRCGVAHTKMKAMLVVKPS